MTHSTILSLLAVSSLYLRRDKNNNAHVWRPQSNQGRVRHLWFLPSTCPLMILFAPRSDPPDMSEAPTSGCWFQILCVTEMSIMKWAKISSMLLTHHHICQGEITAIGNNMSAFWTRTFPGTFTTLGTAAWYELSCSSDYCCSTSVWGT